MEFFKGIFGLTSSFMKIPVVRADDDDEEEELVDPFDALKINCMKRDKAISMKQRLEECNARVRSKKKTMETCEEEIHDLVKFVDHCIAENLFDHLK